MQRGGPGSGGVGGGGKGPRVGGPDAGAAEGACRRPHRLPGLRAVARGPGRPIAAGKRWSCRGRACLDTTAPGSGLPDPAGGRGHGNIRWCRIIPHAGATALPRPEAEPESRVPASSGF